MQQQGGGPGSLSPEKRQHFIQSLTGDERARCGKADPNLKDLDQSGPLTELMA